MKAKTTDPSPALPDLKQPKGSEPNQVLPQAGVGYHSVGH